MNAAVFGVVLLSVAVAVAVCACDLHGSDFSVRQTNLISSPSIVVVSQNTKVATVQRRNNINKKKNNNKAPGHRD